MGNELWVAHDDQRHRVRAASRACVSELNRSVTCLHATQGPFPNPPFSEAPPFSFCDFGLRDNAYYDKYFWYSSHISDNTTLIKEPYTTLIKVRV